MTRRFIVEIIEPVKAEQQLNGGVTFGGMTSGQSGPGAPIVTSPIVTSMMMTPMGTTMISGATGARFGDGGSIPASRSQIRCTCLNCGASETNIDLEDPLYWWSIRHQCEDRETPHWHQVVRDAFLGGNDAYAVKILISELGLDKPQTMRDLQAKLGAIRR